MTPQITIKSEDGFISTYTLIKPDNNLYIKNASYPEYVVSLGSTCVVYLAEINSRKVLIKEFFDCNHDVKKDHKSISEIVECHSKEYKNYILTDSNQGFSGHDENGTLYHVFPQFQGDTIRPQIITDKENFIGVLEEFSDFLDHLNLIHSKYIHWDIKASNCIRFGIHSNQTGKCHWELIDFDISCKIDDASVYGHGTSRPTSPEWYSDRDLIAYNKLSPDQLAECRFVLDITAAAKLLSYSICGYTQYRRTEFITSHEGYCTALARIFRKAFHRDLTQRHKSATELKDDIQAIIEASKEKQSSAMAWNIREMNNSPLKKMYKVDSLYEVKNHKIDAEILTDIKCDELGPEPFRFDEDKGSALEQLLDVTKRLLDATNKHVWLVGEAGGGKSTSLHYLYLESLRKYFTDVAVVYKKLSECSFGSDYSKVNLKELIETLPHVKTPILVLLDSFDEVNERRALEGQKNEQDSFDSDFLQNLKSAPSNVRFVVTSRFKSETICKSDNFITASFQPLKNPQIFRYLKVGEEEISENSPLLRLLLNPFYLFIFAQLKKFDNDEARSVVHAAQLIDSFLRTMYQNKAAPRSKATQIFEEYLISICDEVYNTHVDSIINNADVYLDIRDVRYLEPFTDVFNNYIYTQVCDDNSGKYKLIFSHELIKEWCLAYAMKNKFGEIQLGEINPDAISFLDNHYSYETLLLFAQMTLSSKIEACNQENKLKFEYLCKNFRMFIPLDSSIFSSDKKEPSEEESWFDILIDEEVNADKMRQGTIYCFEKNMLNMVAFVSDGDLSSGFDFGKITTVGRNAFRDCDYLRKIKLPNTFTAIQKGAFSWCEVLEEVFLPDSIKDIEGSVFTESGIREINLSKSLNAIPTSTFWGCNNLSNITIPEGVVKIEGFAFADCKNLKEITLPSSLKFIGPLAFHGAGLKKLLIPKNVNQIMPDAFAYCPIERIDVDPHNKKYSCFSNCLIETKKQTLILGCKNSKIISSDKVKCIGAHAFNGCHIERLTIPYGVVAIYNCAFEGCVDLKEIILPRTLEKIYFDAFFGCAHLERIHIPEALSYIATGAFKGCSGLLEITVDEKNRQYQSVNNCLIEISTKTLIFGGYKDVSIPSDDRVTAIAESAFQQCRELKTILVPQNILSIGMSAFYDCLELQSIELQCKLKEIEDFMFWGCENLSEINLPCTLKRIGDSAFHKCKSLRNLSLPQGLETIEDAAFHTCSNLRFLNIPEGVTSIGADLFQYCNNLEALTIPITVKSIGDSIFFDCFKLQSVFYEGTMSDWENIQKIPPEGEEWSIGNNCKWTGINYKFPITIQCQDGKIEY